MKRNRIFLLAIAATMSAANFGQSLVDINIRDPYILPDAPGGAERARIFELEDTGDALVLKQQIK